MPEFPEQQVLTAAEETKRKIIEKPRNTALMSREAIRSVTLKKG